MPPETALKAQPPLLVALYLPQYHPIPENNLWWGEGFTEWTNVAQARALFDGHYQPHIPADLGFYDLRVAESRQAQADLARRYGIGAFCYYHYWFAGRRLLEKPLNQVLAAGEPDFPFCLCWANQSWSGIWHGAPDRILIEQTYPGREDFIRHFHALLPAFADPRYLRHEGKIVFVVFRPLELPSTLEFVELWQQLAADNGLGGFHFVGFTWDWDWDHQAAGFAAALPQSRLAPMPNHLKDRPGQPAVIHYREVTPYVLPSNPSARTLYPCLLPNWDNTPRAGSDGLVFHGSTPELFRAQVQQAFAWSKQRPENQRIVFIKAWNEWAEGNHLEPDLLHGHGYLEVIRAELAAY